MSGTTKTPAGGLPNPWAAQDIGSVGVVGSATGGSGAFTVQGGGADIWETADAFHYVYQPLAGNGQIVARIMSQQNTHPWAKAGVMIREELTAGARYAAVLVTPGNGVAFQRRAQGGAGSVYTSASGAVPQWVKLVRGGTMVTAYTSPDGTAWTSIGSDAVSMATNVYIGLAVTSHNNAVTSTGTFDNVSKQ